jgi:solute carrier family 25 folate transporter 32
MSTPTTNRWDQFAAGALAGAGTTTILHPLDLLKVRLQVDTSMTGRPQSFMTFRQLAHLVKAGRAYQGYQANLVANVTTWGTYFFIYDMLKHYIQNSHKSQNFFLNSLGYFGASGTAGIVSICITNPLWVVKTRMCLQVSDDPTMYRNVPVALYRIAKQEGIKGLYRGLLPGLFGTTHGAVQFTVYEQLKRMCEHFDIPQAQTLNLLSIRLIF